MFNLLPKNLKNVIKTNYRMRLFTLIMIFIIFIQVSFLIFLFPSWLISFYREVDANSASRHMNQLLLNSKLNSIASTTSDLNLKLTTLNSTLDYPKIIPLMLSIISKKTQDIHINELSYNASGGEKAELTLGGVSATRESLVSFVKNLQNSSNFSKVDLPISNFAKDKNIFFSINISVK